jgi:hypothetical protein
VRAAYRRDIDRPDRRRVAFSQRCSFRTDGRCRTDPRLIRAQRPSPSRLGGNRQINRALHVIAITRGRRDPATRAYLQRKEAEGKSRIEASDASSATSHAGTTGCSAKDRDQRVSCSETAAWCLNSAHHDCSHVVGAPVVLVDAVARGHDDALDKLHAALLVFGSSAG